MKSSCRMGPHKPDKEFQEDVCKDRRWKKMRLFSRINQVKSYSTRIQPSKKK